jgi:hypothetical protein
VVVELAFADSSLFRGDRTLLAQRFASEIMDRKEKGAERSDILLLLVRSAPNPRAADILRDGLARHCERPLKALLQGPRASERAAMILALATGFHFFRKVIGTRALADASGAGLFDDLAAMFQSLIDGPAARPPPSPASHAWITGRVRTRSIK